MPRLQFLPLPDYKLTGLNMFAELGTKCSLVFSPYSLGQCLEILPIHIRLVYQCKMLQLFYTNVYHSLALLKDVFLGVWLVCVYVHVVLLNPAQLYVDCFSVQEQQVLRNEYIMWDACLRVFCVKGKEREREATCTYIVP